MANNNSILGVFTVGRHGFTKQHQGRKTDYLSTVAGVKDRLHCTRVEHNGVYHVFRRYFAIYTAHNIRPTLDERY